MNNSELDRVRGNEGLTCGLLEAIVMTLSLILTEVGKHWRALNRGGIRAVLHFKDMGQMLKNTLEGYCNKSGER